METNGKASYIICLKDHSLKKNENVSPCLDMAAVCAFHPNLLQIIAHHVRRIFLHMWKIMIRLKQSNLMQ